MKISIIAVLILFLLPVAGLTGCSSDTPDIIPDNEFTLSDFENANSAETVFSQYAAVRVEGEYYGYIMDFGEPTDLTQIIMALPGEYHTNFYWDSPEPLYFQSSIEDGTVYFRDEDGTFGLYGFFDDGAFEAYFLPYTQRQAPAYMAYDGNERITSVTTRDGVRYVTIEVNLSDDENSEWSLGISADGVIETVFALDPVTNLIQSMRGYLIPTGEEPRLINEGTVTYGEAGDFALPEYVAKAKDMSSTRTVQVVLNVGDSDEKVFTFTLPKEAAFIPYPMEEYEEFADAGLTVPYIPASQGEYPDEETIYMRRLAD